MPLLDLNTLTHFPEREVTESIRVFEKWRFKRPVLKISYFLPENLEKETILRVPGETCENRGNVG
jgi:hypothetical protein